MSEGHRTHEQQCSFCRKHIAQVLKIVAGPDVSICNECVMLCHEILLQTNTAVPEAKVEQRGLGSWLRRLLAS